MKHLSIIMALSLSSCSPLAAVLSLPPSPAALCDKTLIDERAGIAMESAYNAFRLVVETGVDAGLIHGAKATQLRRINTALYRLTIVEQEGYKTCNATSYLGAISEGKATILAGYQVLGN